MSNAALSRLMLEHQKWNEEETPFRTIEGLIAFPTKTHRDSPLNFMLWYCVIPGREETPWAGGKFGLRMIFKKSYPNYPPKCCFTRPLFHPNISKDGTIYLALLDKSMNWRPDLSVKEILQEIQETLHNPDMNKIKNVLASNLYTQNRLDYNKRVEQQAKNQWMTELDD